MSVGGRVQGEYRNIHREERCRMSKRKKKHLTRNRIGDGIDFCVLSAPYVLDEDDTPQIQYERYMEDDNRHMDLDGKKFYKIICTYTMHMHGQHLIIAVVEKSMNSRIGYILVDEDGREFTVTGIETLHPTETEITECCHRTTYLVLKVDSMEIGKYLAIKERQIVKNLVQKFKNLGRI